MNTALSKSPSKSVSIRVPKIRSLLKAGDDAGIRYYREAGVELNQAKAEWEGPGFMEWAVETFDRKETQLRRYMSLPEAPRRGGTIRSALGASYGSSNHGRPGWERPVREVVNRINVRAMAQERQNREKEEKIQRQLALQLIDIGYKVLATKLHPDKQGGSTEAFQRLKEVRDRLKEVYS